MQPALLDILQHQQRGGFPDLAGTEASATIPISDRLLNEVIATLMPKEGRSARFASDRRRETA